MGSAIEEKKKKIIKKRREGLSVSKRQRDTELTKRLKKNTLSTNRKIKKRMLRN